MAIVKKVSEIEEKSTTSNSPEDTTDDQPKPQLELTLELFQKQITELQQAHHDTHELLIEVLRDHNNLCDLCDNLTAEVANFNKTKE